MAKYKKVAKRKINPRSIIVLVFVLSFFGWLHSSIFVRNTNVALNVEIQQINRDIAQTQIVNDSLNLEIQDLASYDHVSRVAREAGLKNLQNNISSISERP